MKERLFHSSQTSLIVATQSSFAVAFKFIYLICSCLHKPSYRNCTVRLDCWWDGDDDILGDFNILAASSMTEWKMCARNISLLSPSSISVSILEGCGSSSNWYLICHPHKYWVLVPSMKDESSGSCWGQENLGYG